MYTKNNGNKKLMRSFSSNNATFFVYTYVYQTREGFIMLSFRLYNENISTITRTGNALKLY